jgi:hypothetical protein
VFRRMGPPLWNRFPVNERGKQRLLIQHLDVSNYLGSAMNRISGGS